MNVYSFLGVLLLSSVALAGIDPTKFIPCAFQTSTFTHIYSGGAEIATSEDAIYHDHDNLWRWESEFSGVSGLFDPHVWAVIWRPDYNASYHRQMLTGKCLKNNGGKNPYPYPFDWVMSKLDKDASWSQDFVIFNDRDAVVYTLTGKSTRYKFDVVVNLYTLKSGEFVFGNGTVKSGMIDLDLRVDVNQFVSKSPLAAGLFVPDQPCDSLPKPASAAADFEAYCYRHPSSSAGFIVNPCIFALVSILLAAFLMSFAL